LVEVDLSIPLAKSGEDNPVDEARTSISPTGTSDRPPSHRDTTSDSAPLGVIACAALIGLSESAANTRSGSIVTTGCKVTGEPSASVDADDAETAIAKVGVEADGVLEPAAAANVGDTGRAVAKGAEEADGSPDIMAPFPPEEVGEEADGVLDPTAAANVGDTGRAVAKGEVEADSSPDSMASFPPEEDETTAPTTVVEKVGGAVGEIAATPDDKIGVTGRTAFP
jgi:hypothetical protein